MKNKVCQLFLVTELNNTICFFLQFTKSYIAEETVVILWSVFVGFSSGDVEANGC